MRSSRFASRHQVDQHERQGHYIAFLYIPPDASSLGGGGQASTLTDCQSAPGFYGAPGVAGTPCPQDDYCPLGATGPEVP